MKKLLLTTALALLTALYAWAYADFSVVSGGNTLYYEITDTENKEVAVVNETGNPTNPYTTKPIGILIIPETVTNGRTTYTVTSIGDYAFYECDSLTEVTIGNSVTTIGVCAFYGCKSLTEVTIPNSVTSIVGSAFSNCDSLTEVTIPNSVTTIGGSAFNETAWLKNQTDEFVIVGNGILIKYNGAGGSVTIPNSVTSIGDGAFYECKSLTEVTIGNSVTNIGNVAFYDCDSLTKVTIPNSVTSIGQSAFQNCDSLTEVTIGNSVKSIGDRTFYECKSLKEITIGNSVTSIGECAFQNCDSLTEVTIPNSVKSIGVMAFYECKSLTKVTIGNSVTSIGESAFLNCDSLKKVTIGNSVTTIGSGAFYGCSGLTEVINYATKPQDIINSNVFPMERYKITISVPAGSVEAYEAADEWKDFKIKAYIDFAATTTEGYELEYVVNDDSTAVSCVGMVSKVGEGSVNLAIPSSVTHEGVTYAVTNIGERAFYGCESLSTVAIPSSVTEIGAKAFTECTGLSAINVDANNANYCVEDGILYNKTQDVLIACPAGKTGELTITNSVTSIEPYAFFVCSGHQKINCVNPRKVKL